MKISDIKRELKSIQCSRHKIELEVHPFCPECKKEYMIEESTDILDVANQLNQLLPSIPIQQQAILEQNISRLTQISLNLNHTYEDVYK